MSVVLIPLLAVAAIAIGWLWLANRTQREPTDSVAQFSRALTALAPPPASPPTDRHTGPSASNKAG